MNLRENHNQKNHQTAQHKEIVDNIYNTLVKLRNDSDSLDCVKCKYIFAAMGILAKNIPNKTLSQYGPPEEEIIAELFEIKELLEMHLVEFIDSLEELDSEIKKLEAL